MADNLRFESLIEKLNEWLCDRVIAGFIVFSTF
jgi:hypothetical protein